MAFSKLIDMRKTDAEKAAEMSPWSPGAVSEYPYGLSIRLTQDEIDKLGVDHGDWEIGDIFDLRAMARVTSISTNETGDGMHCCVELQIVMMAAESEDTEEPVSRVNREKKKSRLYKE